MFVIINLDPLHIDDDAHIQPHVPLNEQQQQQHQPQLNEEFSEEELVNLRVGAYLCKSEKKTIDWRKAHQQFNIRGRSVDNLKVTYKNISSQQINLTSRKVARSISIAKQ